MKMGVLGTGTVGTTIGTKLAQLGHQVMMGSRSASSEKAAGWVKSAGTNASQGTLADAAKFGEVLFNCTSGMASLDALKAAGKDNLAGKILPDTKVVKTLNTLTAHLMTNPAHLPGDHHLFMSGNDAGAKTAVVKLLMSFGWKPQNIIDLGDITTARGTEQLLPLWVRLWGKLQNPNFNFHVVGPEA